MSPYSLSGAPVKGISAKQVLVESAKTDNITSRS